MADTFEAKIIIARMADGFGNRDAGTGIQNTARGEMLIRDASIFSTLPRWSDAASMAATAISQIDVSSS